MALARRRNSWHQHTNFPFGNASITLPNEIIKTYLPRLWSRARRRAQAEGYLDLEELGIVQGRYCHAALSVILRALKFSEAGRGVANELRRQLDRARADHAHHTPSLEYAMSRIFYNVAQLVRKTGPNQEMAYAMAEWFEAMAVDRYIHPEFLFIYIIALDGLRADMTGPLHTLLREAPMRSADVQIICERLRPITRKRLMSFWKDHIKIGRPRRAILPRGNGLIEGGDVCWGDIVRSYEEDPNSIIVRLGRRHRASRNDRETDDDYSTDTDTSEDDDEYCPYAYGFPRVHDPSSFHPLHGPLHAPPRLCGPPPFMIPLGRCIPPLLEAGPLPLRPQFGRFQSYPT
ncbi:MAG: hypothetical protein L6R38_009502 [Xanthoria sp. 2 TBL-2021]|nr:MAG: hypothetical protein L6R38_009502 [Xanthoria sp. 2 TBL-2021]